MPSIDPVALIAAADKQVAKLRSQGKDYSFNELLSMYTDKELIIDPAYQRLFRWSDAKQSRFIESLILELPLPPIYLIEIDSGKYELIDGLQRFASYVHFRGELDAPHREIKYGTGLTLTDCDIVTELNGLSYNDLPTVFQIRLKRHTVRAEVIRKESDNRLRYHMFKRLNTGGESLSEQEIRNCTIRLLDAEFNNFLIERSQDEDFAECISAVAQDKIDEKYDQELVLRFFGFKNWIAKYVHEVGSFLTEYMEAVAEPQRSGVVFDYPNEKAVFQKTFQVLRTALEDKAFAQVIRGKKGERIYPFSIYHFESFTLGIQPHLASLDAGNDDQMNRLKECCWAIKKNSDFQDITTGGGKNSKGALAARIGFVAERLRAVV